jgi:hypothetical protein
MIELDNELNTEYFKVPNDLHYAVKNVYEYAMLSYLLRLRNGTNKHPFPSFKALQLNGLMGRRKAILTEQSLMDKGFISVENTPFKSNTYTVHIDVILRAIRQNMPTEELTKKANRELKEYQIKAITKQNMNLHPDWVTEYNEQNNKK